MNPRFFTFVASNERYVHRSEKDESVAKQPALGRPEATWGIMHYLARWRADAINRWQGLTSSCHGWPGGGKRGVKIPLI